MIRFFIALLLTGLVSAGATFLLIETGTIPHWPSFAMESLILLILSMGIIFRYLYKISQPELFVSLYLLTMVVKLIAYGAYCYFMIASDQSGSAQNLVFFLVNYLVFTALEIVFLYKKTKTGTVA